MRARLRIAWKATCGSSAHACTPMSPPPRAGSSSSPGSGGISASSGGRLVAILKRSPGPGVPNRLGPKPKVMVSREGDSPTASPVSTGGANSPPPSGTAGSPLHIRAADRVHTRSRSTSSCRLSVVTSKAANWIRFCCGVMIPAWCGP
jgi:hypothetical protein